MKTSGSLFKDWTIQVLPVDGTYDVFVTRENMSGYWTFSSYGWKSEESAYQKGELWIQLKEAQERFRTFDSKGCVE